MGVQGLWKIVGPVARPITLESLEDKRLAIDASIWLYQFQMAMRDRKTGDTLHGAHIMGTFRRILKLLFHGIKPVFVFDGDAPMLKKRTIEKRKRRKQGAGNDLAKTAQKLLSAQLRTRDALTATAAGNSDVDTGEQVGADAVYLEDLDKPASPLKTIRKDALRDEYALPQSEGPLASRAKMSDPRIATEEELREFIEDLRPEDLDIESEFFSTLPTEVKYEILGDLRLKTRQVNHRRVQQMRGAAAVDFSRAQINHLMERNQYTQKLLSVTDELGKSAIAIPTRVAGSRNREYILVKQDASKGGGWVLGVKNPEVYNTEPITIDTTTDESVDEHTDTDEFEEVVAPQDEKAGLPTPDVQARRALAEEAVRARFAAAAPGPVADPYLDQPVASTSRGTGLFQQDAAVDDEDVILQRVLYESAQSAEAHDLHRPSLPPAASTSRLAGSPAQPHQPVASSSRSISVTIPSLPQPPPPSGNGAGADETDDDDLEYVSVPVTDHTATTAAQPNAPAPASPPAAPIEADGEGSDEFEEVAVAPPSRPPLQPAPLAPAPASAPPFGPPTASSFAPLSPSHRPPRPASSRPVSPPPMRPRTPPTPEPAPTRTLFDSMLPSDSESESETSPRKPPPAPLPLPLPTAPSSAAPPATARLSPSPDPFQRFDAVEQGDVQARDFAASPPREAAPRSPAPPEPPIRSPSPPVARASSPSPAAEPRRRSLPPEPAEEAEALQVLEREEEAFADVMAQLRNEKIEKMRAEAEKDVLKLSEQRNVEMRNADGVTRQMAVDIKELLILFGIPYVDAPMEAEAECASLLSRQLVDGIVTDDSDVFLFGGSRIYRNMFNESKYVECYLLADLEREIGLDRDKLVRLAYLLGSDYTEGLPGVGPVAGRELLEEFPGKNGLVRFREWWDRVQNGKDSEQETNTSWKRRFKKGHKELVLDKGWPSPDVAEAYYRPTVVESDEHFSWSGVDLDGLRFYLNRALGWDQTKTDSLLLPLIKREQERKAGAHSKQPVMTDFFDYTAGDAPFSRKKQPKYASKRLQNVVQVRGASPAADARPCSHNRSPTRTAMEGQVSAKGQGQGEGRRRRR
ncbi:hypothetical protein DMC30DRAFT_351638 [Rhodotorula diobovata]|uniref:PIN domain-like protein n=1 Tax=Rhodotorula diobovata TaxID=5288 RepID=A0A5C5FYT9_9BASI|nr:hypothetical protein DMC30DRAFT_351638 [Rhodotorula diobovata]